MQNKKILFLDCNGDDYFRKEREKVNNVTARLLYKKVHLYNKMIRFLGLYLWTPILYFAYGSWKKELDKYDIFILPSRRSAKYALSYIKKKTKKRVIVWYWNIVTKEELNPQYCKDMGAEVWTFDKNDAEKYQMKYNNTYYFDEIARNIESDMVKNDVFYVGVEKKGRYELLQDLKKEFTKQGITYNINLVRNKNYKSNFKIKYGKEMQYEEVVENIKKSRAILDINNIDQIALTLRPLEAIFFRKKLITNNKNIKNFEFYNKNNIFIIGEDDMKRFTYFINNDYEDIDSKIIEKYKFKIWLERIIDSNVFMEEE